MQTTLSNTSEWPVDVYDDVEYARPWAKVQNPLLIRPKIGQVKKSTFNLPHANFAYGLQEKRDVAGAKEAISGWKIHVPNPEAMKGIDFVRSNKAAMDIGCKTAKDVADFRKTNEIRLLKGKRRNLSPRIAEPENGFGFIKTGPPESMYAVVSNAYQRQWILQQRATYGPSEVAKRRTAPKPTKASLARQVRSAPPPKPEFKLRRFLEVPARVQVPHP